MFKGFKEFLFRGNVIDLSIAVVIGTAFTALVTSVVDHVVNPLIASVGGANVNGLAYQLVSGNPKSIIDVGAVVSAVLNFALIAAIVYVVLVVPTRRLMALREGAPVEQAEVGPSEDVVLLREIRDLLRGAQPAAPATPADPAAPHRDPRR